MRAARVIAGLILAPLAPSALIALGSCLQGAGMLGFLEMTGIGMAILTFIEIAFAVPLHLVILRGRPGGWISLVGIGFGAAALPYLLLAPFIPGIFKDQTLPFTYGLIVVFAGAIGAFAGLIFWLTAIYGDPPRRASPRNGRPLSL